MDTLIPALLRRQRNRRRLTLENLSAKGGSGRGIAHRDEPMSLGVEHTFVFM